MPTPARALFILITSNSLAIPGQGRLNWGWISNGNDRKIGPQLAWTYENTRKQISNPAFPKPMTAKDIFNVAIRILGLVFLYRALLAIQGAATNALHNSPAFWIS